MAIKTKIRRSAEEDVMLLYDAFDDFIAEKEAVNLSPATIHNYEATFELVSRFFGWDNDTTTQEITQQHVYKWIGTVKKDGLSISSINHYLRDLRAFFNWCMDADRAYMESFKIHLLEVQEEIPKLYDDGELELLLDKPRKRDSFSDWRSWAIVNWVLATGNRESTICNIQMQDVDFKKKEIRITRTKNKQAQIIPLSASLETVLKEYIRVWRKGAPGTDYLFCNIGLEKLTTDALRKSYRKYCQDRDVSHTSLHGLRHNFAKGWVKNNGNMFALQKMLGHSTLDMTRRYVKLFGEDLKDDFAKYNPLDVMKRKQKRTHNVRRNDY